MTPAPGLSIVLPTLNAERHLAACLSALMSQDYPRDRFEILLVDAGSTDRTLEIAQQHGVDKVLPNTRKTGEAGKAVGIRAADGDLIVSIDSDNVVIGSDWLRRMVAPFEDPEVIASEVKGWDYWPADTTINRWHALSGVADPLTLYTGNYARDSLMTGRWTDMPHRCETRQGWDRITLEPGHVPVLGANGFVVRASAFDVVPLGDYHFDLDFVHELVLCGYRTIARVDARVRHHFCDDLRGFVRKTRRRADDFFYFSRESERSYPWTRRARAAGVRFILETMLVLPVLRDALRGIRRRRDRAWLFHPVACWVTLVVYAIATIRGRVRPRMLDREDWRQ